MAEFNPASIPGLNLWLDASDSETITVDGSNRITNLADKSGNGYAATSPIGPTVTNVAATGMQYARFLMADTAYLQTNYMPPLDASPRSFFIAGYDIAIYGDTSLYPSQFIFDYGDGKRLSKYGAAWKLDAGTGGIYVDFGSLSSYVSSSTIGLAGNAPFQTEFTYDGTTQIIRHNADITHTHAEGLKTAGVNNLVIGASINLDLHSDFYFGEFLAFNRVLTTQEREEIEGYLAWKWGNTAELPTTHPYKYSWPYGAQEDALTTTTKATATAQANSATVTTTAIINAAVLTGRGIATAQAMAPQVKVSTEITVATTMAQATAQALPGIIRALSGIGAKIATASASGIVPTVYTEVFLSISVAQATATSTAQGIAPSVKAGSVDDVILSTTNGTATVVANNAVVFADGSVIIIDPSVLYLTAGSAAAVEARTKPYVDKRILWSVSDPGIASILTSDSGTAIVAAAEGSAILTARTEDGSLSATIAVYVVAEVPRPAYDGLKTLDATQRTETVVDSLEILDLEIRRELSGDHSLQLVLPYGAVAIADIKRGSYIEAEGSRYRVEIIAPARGADGNPIYEITAVHEFFELAERHMSVDLTMFGTVMEHMQEILKGTDFSVQLMQAGTSYATLSRYVSYTKSDTKLDAVKAVMATFGGFYRLTARTVELFPPEDEITPSGLTLEYAVTNVAIAKEEDSSEVVTVLYATGGLNEEGEPLQRVLYAPFSVRSEYRMDRVRFVDFSDVRVQSNFEYLTNRFLSENMHPRTTYELDTAELKRIGNIGEIYPGRDFEIEIGKVATVRDADLGIDVQRVIRSYVYSPLVPESPSRITLGAKSRDITWQESRRADEAAEGEWRYDEAAETWIFFPYNDWEEAEAGDEWVLTLNSDGPGDAEIIYRYIAAEDRAETVRVTIETVAQNDGPVAIELNGSIYTVSALRGDSRNAVAYKLSVIQYPGWTVQRNGYELLFTADTTGAKAKTARWILTAAGVEATITTTKGTTVGLATVWQGGAFPFSRSFPNTGTVEAKLIPDDYTKLVEWLGDGSGTDPRTFTMGTDQDATAKIGLVDPRIQVETISATQAGTDTFTLYGEVVDTERYGNLSCGFEWGKAPDQLDNDVSAGYKEEEVFSETVTRDPADPAVTVYYFRAYGEVYDPAFEDYVRTQGQIATFTFPAVGEESLTVTSDRLSRLADLGITLSPAPGVHGIPTGNTVTLTATLPESTTATLTEWQITGSGQTNTASNPYAFSITGPTTVEPIFDFPTSVLVIGHEPESEIRSRNCRLVWSDGTVQTQRIGSLFARRPGCAWVDVTVSAGVVLSGDDDVKYEWEDTGQPVTDTRRVTFVSPEYTIAVNIVATAPEDLGLGLHGIISTTEPDPTRGQEDTLWIKYEEGV